MRNNYRLDGPSLMYRALLAATPDPKFQSGTVYSGLAVGGLEIEKLVYFGASIFWRASVAEWMVDRKRKQFIHLGQKYEEAFRHYLNGELAFPVGAALWVAVDRSESPAPVIAYPSGETNGKYHRHHFDVFGLS